MEAHGDERGRAGAQAVPGDHQAPAAAVQLALHDGRHQVPPPLSAALAGALPAAPASSIHLDSSTLCFLQHYPHMIHAHMEYGDPSMEL